jgi:predicted transcriptional regulator
MSAHAPNCWKCTRPFSLRFTAVNNLKGRYATVESMEKRRKYIGVGGDDVPSLGVLEGDILRLLWDAGEPQSSVQVYEAMHFSRRAEKREMQSPSTIAVTLSRMVEKGLLTVDRRPKGGKGYYGPTKTRAAVVADIMNDVAQRLTGQTIGFVLSQLTSGSALKENSGLEELVKELQRRQAEDNAFVSYEMEKY